MPLTGMVDGLKYLEIPTLRKTVRVAMEVLLLVANCDDPRDEAGMVLVRLPSR